MSCNCGFRLLFFPNPAFEIFLYFKPYGSDIILEYLIFPCSLRINCVGIAPMPWISEVHISFYIPNYQKHWYQSLLKLVGENIRFICSVLLYIKLKLSIKGFFYKFILDWKYQHQSVFRSSFNFSIERVFVSHWGALQSCSKVRRSALCADSIAVGSGSSHLCSILCFCGVLSWAWKRSLSNLYFLGTYFKNIVIDFTIRK